MGQSSSRSQRSAPQNATTSTSSPQAAAAEPSASNSQPAPSEPPPSSRSRSSLRKKVVSMIRPGPHREREDAGSERASRRLSKSPAQPQVLEDAQQAEASSSHRPPSPALSNDKGKSRADEEESPEEPRADTPPPPLIARAPTPPPPPVPAPVLSAPVPAPAPARALGGLQDDSVARDILSRWRSEIQDSSDEEDNVPSRANLTRNPLSPAPPQTNATARQFPPPGTLVVVQGIVHTADVSRPPTDRSSTGTEARGGAFTRSSPPSSFGRSSTDSSTTSASESLPSSETGSRSSGISPGSVDVLGTLLSVAAAATAASLLTGSSEPILSPGLAPPGSTNPGSPIGGDQAAAQEQDTTFAASRAERMRQAWGTIRERLGLRPTPSPRTSLGLGLGAASGLGGPGAGSGATDTREIMLEEMARAFNIGLGLNGFGTAPSSGSTSTTTSPDGDVRARGTVPVDDEISEENTGSGTLPPEGSFDRFLVDLQSDLRVALTGDETEEGSGDRQQPEQEATEAPIDSTSTQAASTSQPPPPSTTPPPLPIPAASSMDSEPTTAPALDIDDPAEDVDDDMPPLESVTDSENETRENETTDDDEDDVPMTDEERQRFMDALAREIGINLQNAQPLSEQVDGDATPRATGQAALETPSATNGAPASGPMSSTGSRNGRMDESGRINWWRLYRFPAINSAAPSPSTSPSASPPATTPASEYPTSTNEAPTSSGSQQTASPGQPPAAFATSTNTTPAPAPTTTPFLPNFLPPPAGQTVVPVIVVGLQSVAPGQFGFEVVPATQTHTHTNGHLHNHNHTHNLGRPPQPTPSFAAPAPAHPRTRQEELAVLEDMLREAEAEAEADALLYDSLERLTRGSGRGAPGAGVQDRNVPWERLTGHPTHESHDRSRGQRVTVEEVEDEDTAGPSRPRPQPRRDVDVLIAEDEALDLEDADDEEEDSDDEKEDAEVSEEEEDDEDEARDDFYRRSDRNARARALAKAEAKKEAKLQAKEEKKRRKERREKARQARAARLAAAADARARAAANATSSPGASGSGGGDAFGTSPVRGASIPLGNGGERERGTTGTTAWSRYAEQLRDLHSQMREERGGPALRSPVSPLGAGLASPLRPPIPGTGAGGLGVGMTMGGVGGMGGGTGAGMGMGMGLPSGPGSRTFLIYVIGGYYPPDHTIVTGGPESFQSFEALLELAEMLGHAKPPTVTKEEIEKSGLETIKPAQLAEYEEAGKISSNCTERCLICLDDYEPEDDVRVMSCRHAFHQGCVDTWLQTGRNNCPACRSTGVNAEANSTTA